MKQNLLPCVAWLALMAGVRLPSPQIAATVASGEARSGWFHQNIFQSILGPVAAPTEWMVAPCEGSAPMLCVTQGPQTLGVVELLVYPLSSRHELLAFIDAHPGGSPIPLLQNFAAQHLATVEADRRASYGDDLDFQPTAAGAVKLGNLSGWSYGFVARDREGRVVERYVHYAAADPTALYVVAATSDPGAIPRFERDEDLLAFLPYLTELLARLSLPAPVETSEVGKVEVIDTDVPLSVVYGAGFYSVVPLGTVATVRGQSPDGQWWYVELNGGLAGWLPADSARVRLIGESGR